MLLVQRLSCPPVLCLSVLCLSVLLVGCTEQEEIRTYEATPTASERQMRAALLAEMQPRRTLAAIVPGEQNTWFFKLLDRQELVGEVAEEFTSIIKSIRFAGGKPQWEAPAGWETMPGPAPAWKSLVKTVGRQRLRLTVTELPNPTERPGEYVLANVNRWRRQLGLPAIDQSRLPEITEPIETAGGLAIVVDLASQEPAVPAAKTPHSKAPSTPAGLPFEFDVPAEWSPGQVGGLRRAAFVVGEGQRTAEITVIPLTAAAWEENMLGNYNRWRGQVGLEEAGPTEFDANREIIDAAGEKWHYMEMIGDQDGKSMLVAVNTHDAQAWFFKAIGPTPLIQQERDRFKAFIRSVRYR